MGNRRRRDNIKSVLGIFAELSETDVVDRVRIAIVETDSESYLLDAVLQLAAAGVAVRIDGERGGIAIEDCQLELPLKPAADDVVLVANLGENAGSRVAERELRVGWHLL